MFDILGAAWDFVSSGFEAAVGWAWDTVVGGITDWVVKAVVALVMLLWRIISATTSPHLDAEWFSGREGSPWWMAVQIGIPVLTALVTLAIARSVLAGSPGMAVPAAFRDLPLAVLAMLGLLVVVQAGIDLTDAIADWIWVQTADSASEGLDGLALTLTHIPGMSGSFLGVVLALVLLVAMLFTWIVLTVRESMIYITVVYAAAFGLPALVYPVLRDTAKQIGHLLLALVLAKPAVVLAIAVGVNATSGIGATGEPGDPVVDNALAEFGTIVIGIVTFGLASFMPFVVYKLLPVVAAAAVAHGVVSGPMRAMQQGMSMSYYGGRVMDRLTSSSSSSSTRASSNGSAGGDGAVIGTDGGVAPAGTSATGASAPTGAAAAAAGPAGVVVTAGATVKETTVGVARSTGNAAGGGGRHAASPPADPGGGSGRSSPDERVAARRTGRTSDGE